MPFDIEHKLVVAIASSAVLTLDKARDEFREHGLEAYRKYQREHQHDVLEKGPAFAFVKRLLNFNRLFPDIQPVEVVLISHNDSDLFQKLFQLRELECERMPGNPITAAVYPFPLSPPAAHPRMKGGVRLCAKGTSQPIRPSFWAA